MIVGGWPWEAEGILLNKNLSEGLPWQSRDKDFTFQSGESGQGRRGLGSIPGQRAKIPYTLWPKNPKIKNRSSIVTNLIKTLKMVHIKKKKRKKLPESEPYKTGSRDERYLVLGSLESSLSLSGMLKIFTA